MLIYGDVRQAVIMVGGKGTRLRPLTNNCPKPILPILDKPCTGYFIDSLAEAGIEEVIMACGFGPEQMEPALGDGSKQGIKVTYSYEDPENPLGTGGAIKFIEDKLDDTFIALNGDNFMDIDFRRQIDEHRASGAAVTISLSTTDNPTEVGIVGLDDDGNVTRFKEKPKPEEVFSNILNTGVYVINKEVLQYIPKDTLYDISKELFPYILEKGYRIHGYKEPGHWMDVGRPKDYLEANLMTAKKRFPKKDWSAQAEDSIVTGRSYFGEGSKAKNCMIRSGVILENCTLTDCKVKDSMFLSGCIADGAVVENSIIGKGCRLGKRCKIVDSVLADDTVVEEGKTLGNFKG